MENKKYKIAFLGNFHVDFSSESHHKKSLEALGHEVIILQEGTVRSDEVLNTALKADIFIWVHTHGWYTRGRFDMRQVLIKLKLAGKPTLSYHLDLWFGLKRQQDLRSDSIYQYIQYFFTVDKKMAEWFNSNTKVKGRYLPAAVFDQEAYISEVPSRISNDVVFVGSKNYHPEWQYRLQLVNWLEQTYGDKFTRANGDTETGVMRGDDLNRFYIGSKVAVGDSLCINFDYPYYWSDRVYETLGRGGFMIHPYIEGMEEHFEDGKHLVFYKFGDFEDLKSKIDYYLEHNEEREVIRLAGHEHVKTNHTYKNRWAEIIKEVMHEN